MSFLVQLESFRGPLDLLLYLVRRHELLIDELPLRPIAEQFWATVEGEQEADIDLAADFLDLASTLVELKSRNLLPREQDPDARVPEDPAEDLVSRLLEYKQFRDAASMLDERSRQWQRRIARTANDLGASTWEASDAQTIVGLELWDLVSAYSRLGDPADPNADARIQFDETPIHVYMQRICDHLARRQRVAISEFFAPGMHKTAMIGVFLAILELVRHHSVSTQQEGIHGEIWVLPGERFDAQREFNSLDDERPAAKLHDGPLDADDVDAPPPPQAAADLSSPDNIQGDSPPPAES